MKESQSGGPTKGSWLSPSDVQQKELRVSRFGGYKMRDVDEFLDEVTDSLSALVAEVERLRSRPAEEGMVGVPDLEDVGRQADEIIQRARAEAARIVADARLRSASGATTTGSKPAPGERAAIGGFLTQERGFLESLARLVQDHAETMKAMAKAARERAAGSGEATMSSEVATEERASAGDPTTSTDEPMSEDVEPEEASSVSATVEEGTDDDPVLIEEPQPASVAGRDRDDEPTTEGGGSLRDLFWGDN